MTEQFQTKTRVTDRGGRTTVFIHDALKRLIQTVNPEGGITQFGYDANGNRLTETLNSQPSTLNTLGAYDLDNRLIRKTYADGRGPLFRYDQAGLLTTRTNARGITTAYTYDANHNLLTTAYSDDTPGVTNTYDAFNRLTLVKDGVGTNAYAYDANSRLASFDGPWADDTITYAFDALGRRTNLLVQGSQPAYPRAGQPTGYDALALSGWTPTVQTGEEENRIEDRTRFRRGQFYAQPPLWAGGGKEQDGNSPEDKRMNRKPAAESALNAEYTDHAAAHRTQTGDILCCPPGNPRQPAQSHPLLRERTDGQVQQGLVLGQFQHAHELMLNGHQDATKPVVAKADGKTPRAHAGCRRWTERKTETGLDAGWRADVEIKLPLPEAGRRVTPRANSRRRGGREIVRTSRMKNQDHYPIRAASAVVQQETGTFRSGEGVQSAPGRTWGRMQLEVSVCEAAQLASLAN